MTVSVHTEAGGQKGVCPPPASVQLLPLFLHQSSAVWATLALH